MCEMTREDLILKWLNNDLNAAEKAAFDALEDAQELQRMDAALQGFKAPDYDSQAAYENLRHTLREPQVKPLYARLMPMMRVAAILIVALGIFYFTYNRDVHFSTAFAEKSQIELPDNSLITLNAASELQYNKRDWQNKRQLQLNGEAFFDVETGSKFTVSTPYGTVSVLGTEFNVKQRDNLFEVKCYEGAVQVKTPTYTQVLEAGDQFLMLDGKIIAIEKETGTSPTWLNNESRFVSLPLHHVLKELEYQYGMEIEANNIDTSVLFTGSFPHNNLDVAMKSITLPLHLSYTLNGNRIVIDRE